MIIDNNYFFVWYQTTVTSRISAGYLPSGSRVPEVGVYVCANVAQKIIFWSLLPGPHVVDDPDDDEESHKRPDNNPYQVVLNKYKCKQWLQEAKSQKSLA